MSELLAGKVQTGFGEAAHWLRLFNAAYSEKLGMPVFPGSLNIALDHVLIGLTRAMKLTQFGSAEKSTAASATYCCFPATWLVSIIEERSCGRRRLRQGIDGILGSSRPSLTSI